jgi:hypothetical protein
LKSSYRYWYFHGISVLVYCCRYRWYRYRTWYRRNCSESLSAWTAKSYTKKRSHGPCF